MSMRPTAFPLGWIMSPMKRSISLINRAARGFKRPRRTISKVKEKIQKRKAAAEQLKKQAEKQAARQAGQPTTRWSGRQAADTVSEPAKAVRQERGGHQDPGPRQERALRQWIGARKTIKQASSTAKGTIKATSKSIKTAEKTAKASIKTSQQAAKAAQRTAQATARAARSCDPCRPCSSHRHCS